MAKKLARKLVFKKETISNFEMKNVEGGYDYTTPISCQAQSNCNVYSCNNGYTACKYFQECIPISRYCQPI